MGANQAHIMQLVYKTYSLLSAAVLECGMGSALLQLRAGTPSHTVSSPALGPVQSRDVCSLFPYLHYTPTGSEGTSHSPWWLPDGGESVCGWVCGCMCVGGGVCVWGCGLVGSNIQYIVCTTRGGWRNKGLYNVF